ncbi:hypothetical protein DFJ73DRAFT_757664 [Zopfochytrium polystomum]|nr:hypothetical protein DFJ73DRAFT_757664 [Zopfochytrium polystomum]
MATMSTRRSSSSISVSSSKSRRTLAIATTTPPTAGAAVSLRGAVALTLSLALALALALCPTPSAAADEVRTIGGETVTVHNRIGVGAAGRVFDATDSQGKPVVVKNLFDYRSFSKDEIDATKAAGQYISHEGKSMVQRKVGTQSLDSYHQDKKNSPGGWVPKSGEISRQLEAQQEKIGWLHQDGHRDNVRVDTSKKSPEGIPEFRLIDWGTAKRNSELSAEYIAEDRDKEAKRVERHCKSHGFEFRSGAERGVYRRAAGAGACAVRPGAATAAAGNKKTAATSARKGGTVVKAGGDKGKAGKGKPDAQKGRAAQKAQRQRQR